MKRLVCIVLTVALAALIFTACGSDTQQFDRIDSGNVKHITIAKTAGEDPKYNIVKRQGMAPLADLYNSARFVKADDDVKAEDLLKGTVYTLCYYDFDEKLIAECTFTPDGYVFLQDDLKTPYKLTTEYDEKEIDEVIGLYDENAPKQ